MNGKAELMKYVTEQIYEQTKGVEETLKLQEYLNVLREELENSTSYADFIQKCKSQYKIDKKIQN